MPTQCVIYCRTACAHQTGPDEAPQKQEQICRKANSSFNFKIVETFCDSGVSGASENRSGFNALLGFLSQRPKPMAVMISSRDRLARDFRVMFALEKKLSDLGATLVIINEVFRKEA